MKILNLVLITILVASCFRNSVVESPGKISPIVRLVTREGSTYCTAVIVSTTKALTAAHCVTSGRPIGVRGPDNKELAVDAAPYYIHPPTDSAILTGDFRLFQTAPYYFNIHDVVKHRSDNMITCGYPMGGRLFCTSYVFTRMYGFFWGGNSILIPGMSGGPVFDKDGVVIAINYGVDGKDALVSPVYSIHMLGGDE